MGKICVFDNENELLIKSFMNCKNENCREYIDCSIINYKDFINKEINISNVVILNIDVQKEIDSEIRRTILLLRQLAISKIIIIFNKSNQISIEEREKIKNVVTKLLSHYDYDILDYCIVEDFKSEQELVISINQIVSKYQEELEEEINLDPEYTNVFDLISKSETPIRKRKLNFRDIYNVKGEV